MRSRVQSEQIRLRAALKKEPAEGTRLTFCNGQHAQSEGLTSGLFRPPLTISTVIFKPSICKGRK